MKEKTKWGGSYFEICEIHPRQQFITLGKMFLCLFPHCTEHTLDTAVRVSCCNMEEQGACTGLGACGACTVQMSWAAPGAKKY